MDESRSFHRAARKMPSNVETQSVPETQSCSAVFNIIDAPYPGWNDCALVALLVLVGLVALWVRRRLLPRLRGTGTDRLLVIWLGGVLLVGGGGLIGQYFDYRELVEKTMAGKFQVVTGEVDDVITPRRGCRRLRVGHHEFCLRKNGPGLRDPDGDAPWLRGGQRVKISRVGPHIVALEMCEIRRSANGTAKTRKHAP